MTDKYSKYKTTSLEFTDDLDDDMVTLPRLAKIKKRTPGSGGYEDQSRKNLDKSKHQSRAIKMHAKEML